MIKAVFITNIPSPYRVDFFAYLQKHYPEYEFHIIFSGAGMENRKWSVELAELSHYHFLKSKTLIIRKRFDDRYVFLPVGVEKLLAEIKPDLVFAMEYNPTILRAVHWCRKKRIPFISWTDGTLNSEKNIGKVQRLSRSYIIKRAAAFVASSTASKQAQIAYGRMREMFSLLSDGRHSEISARKGRLQRKGTSVCGKPDPEKGLDLLLPALAETSEDIHLTIVGEGQERELLTEQAGKLGITDRIRFLGYVEGEPLRELYHNADVFILPTREDCFGLVILEAMCASLPVISSKYADGAFDLVAEGENGYIVDPEDTHAFAEDRSDFADENRLKEMGTRSYERAHAFAFEEVAKGCIDALCYVMGKAVR